MNSNDLTPEQYEALYGAPPAPANTPSAPPPPQATSQKPGNTRPWWQRKWAVITAGLLLLTFIGSFLPDPETPVIATEDSSSSTTTASPDRSAEDAPESTSTTTTSEPPTTTTTEVAESTKTEPLDTVEEPSVDAEELFDRVLSEWFDPAYAVLTGDQNAETCTQIIVTRNDNDRFLGWKEADRNFELMADLGGAELAYIQALTSCGLGRTEQISQDLNLYTPIGARTGPPSTWE